MFRKDGEGDPKTQIKRGDLTREKKRNHSGEKNFDDLMWQAGRPGGNPGSQRKKKSQKSTSFRPSDRRNEEKPEKVEECKKKSLSIYQGHRGGPRGREKGSKNGATVQPSQGGLGGGGAGHAGGGSAGPPSVVHAQNGQKMKTRWKDGAKKGKNRRTNRGGREERKEPPGSAATGGNAKKPVKKTQTSIGRGGRKKRVTGFRGIPNSEVAQLDPGVGTENPTCSQRCSG